MRLTASGRHIGGALVEALMLAAILGMALTILSPLSRTSGELSGVGVANAAPGGRGSVTVADGVFAGTVTVTVNPGGSGVWVYAACSQGGTVVWAQYKRPDANSQAVFALGPSELWTGGDATCVAEEGSFSKAGKWRTTASASFSATDPS